MSNEVCLSIGNSLLDFKSFTEQFKEQSCSHTFRINNNNNYFITFNLRKKNQYYFFKDTPCLYELQRKQFGPHSLKLERYICLTGEKTTTAATLFVPKLNNYVTK